jgi:hypothetical protein
MCILDIVCVQLYLAPRGAQSQRIIKQHVVKQHENIYTHTSRRDGEGRHIKNYSLGMKNR